MDWLKQLWQAVTKTRYCRLLEQEVDRLRAENRGLINSLLGTAGVPPIDAPRAEKVAHQPRHPSLQQWQRTMEREAMKGTVVPSGERAS